MPSWFFRIVLCILAAVVVYRLQLLIKENNYAMDKKKIELKKNWKSVKIWIKLPRDQHLNKSHNMKTTELNIWKQAESEDILSQGQDLSKSFRKKKTKSLKLKTSCSSDIIVEDWGHWSLCCPHLHHPHSACLVSSSPQAWTSTSLTQPEFSRRKGTTD